MKYTSFIPLLLIVFVSTVNAAHTGDRAVLSLRQYSPSYVLIYLDAPILSPPTCATKLNAIVLDTTGDQNMRNRQFSMLLTSLTTGLKINPNCRVECVNIWTDVYVTKCSDMWLKK